jgi:hypothetical protein
MAVSLPVEKGPALEAEFEAKKLFMRAIRTVIDGAGVVFV